jgi:hypothetical protein
MIITKPNPLEFTNTLNINITQINRCFKSNTFYLNIDKTHFLQFYTKINQNHEFRILHENKLRSLKT